MFRRTGKRKGWDVLMRKAEGSCTEMKWATELKRKSKYAGEQRSVANAKKVK